MEGDDDDDDAAEDDDDIYILWGSVCVSRKIITSYPPELKAGGAKRDAR